MTDSLQSADYRFESTDLKVYALTNILEALVFHEVGHAILCRLTRRSFHVIVIGDGGGYIGNDGEDVTGDFRRVKSRDETFLKAKPIGFQGELLKPLAARKICVYLAGLQAELLLAGERLEGEIYRDGFDHSNARQHAEEAFGTDSLQYFQGVTRDYLLSCFAELERTANELLARFDRFGFAVIRVSNPGDASFFARDTLPVRWVDEEWN